MFQSLIIVLIGAVAIGAQNLAPVFTADMNQHVVAENTAPGTQVYRLEATDPENGTLSFFIRGTQFFSVDNQTGAVVLVQPLDREVNDSLKFFVGVEDEEFNLSEIPITVIVSDENDNAPVFSQDVYEVKVKSGADVGTGIVEDFLVTDADLVGDIIEVSCTQNEQLCDAVSIVPSVSSASLYRGSVILQKPLSSQAGGPSTFRLVAKDGTHVTSAEVRLFTEDTRRSLPVLIGPKTGLISEQDDIGTLVLTVRAQSSSQGPHRFTYRLLDSSGDSFELEPTTGELRTAKKIDREHFESDAILTVKVRATEIDDVTGQEVESADSVYAIFVQDANDEPPTFSEKEYDFLLHENMPPGTPLSGSSIVVSDRDLDANAMFDLELVDASGLFTVEPKSAIGSTHVSIQLANGSLDYENPNHRKFIVLIVARESNTEEKFTSTATVRVTVQDENDNAPFFERDSYTASVNEDAANDTEIVTIPAMDRDSGTFGTNGLKYELLGDNGGRFIVNGETAAIRTAPCPTPGRAPCLDYESRSTYFLTLKATDDQGRGHSTMVPIRIDLVDSNDNPPHFQEFLFRASVDEGASRFDPPFKVRARDDDLTSVLNYSITGGNTDDLFTIDSRTGEIGVTKPLELNSSLTADEFTLTVEVSDGSSKDTATLIVSIQDVNNNAPMFQQSVYNVSISELVQPGTQVIETLATDSDFGENARLTYKIERASYNKFRIDPQSGIIQVVRPLDFDERNAYSIQIVAVDNGSPSLTGSATVFINVEDHNNKKPNFVPVSQHAQIVRTAALKTVVHTLTAEDPDAQPGSLRYSFIEPITAVDKDGREVRTNSMFKNFFAVNPTSGDVFVTSHLERGVAAVVTLTTQVTDTSANPVQENQGILTITILDVNDKSPVFTKPWSPDQPFLALEVFEEQPVGSVVGQISATDPDSAIDLYEIVPPSPYFEIDPRTGVVTNKERLDFESKPDFNFTVVVYDAGIPQMSSTAQVTVALRNVNDQNPVFTSKHYETTILENSPAATSVLTVSATDGDAGSFGLITYSLTGENAKYFAIDASGVITVADPDGLDRERSPLITLQVAASDLAPPGARRTTITPVEIHLEDVNDNDPKFLVNSYRATVAETVPLLPPPPIVQVTAIDRDAGLNSALRYDIVGGNEEGLFRLDSLTGILYPVVTLVGKPREYNLVVEVRDLNGTGTNSDRATVTITVQSVNQHKPKFTVPSATNATVRVPENAEDETYLVLTLKAEDADPGENGKISFHIRVGEQLVQETPEFHLDPVTGELRTRLKLDREAQASYELLLVAKDGGLQTSYETLRLLTVIVDDEDDNQPEFPAERRTQVAPYHFRIEENVRPDTAVGQVQAFDPDLGLNAKIYYHILEGNEGNWFYIDRTHGFVFNRIELDREQRAQYDLLIKATNDPQYQVNQDLDSEREKRQVMVDPSIAQVHIDVVDINDNPPRFEKDTFYAGVDYSSNSDKFLLQIRASDPDEAINGSLSYFIRSSNLFHKGSNVSSGSVVPSPFHVTPDGRLTTDSLMAQYIQDRFVLEVVAREKAAPFREDSARVHVWVYEPDQLAKIVVAKSLETAVAERELFGDELRNATQLLIVVDEMRHHVKDDGSLDKNLCDVFIHGVEQANNTIASVPDVLRAIDLHYDILRSFNDTAIVNVLAAKSVPKKVLLEPAIIALISLLIVLFVGFVMVIFTCCCIRNWDLSSSASVAKATMRERLVRRQPPSDLLNSTENPLWIDKYVKPYEEQELSMRIAPDVESPNRPNGGPDASNPYATIQKPRRALPPLHLGQDAPEFNDYATLESPYRRSSPQSHPSAVSGLDSPMTTSLTASGATTPHLVLNQNGEPILVGDLI